MNLFAVILCVLWAMFSGYIWYSPFLFEKTWMRLAGLTAKDLKMSGSEMGKMFGTTALLNFIAAYILSTFFMGKNNPVDNIIMMALWLIVFNLIPSYITNAFNRKPMKLMLINCGYQFVSFLGFAVILSFLGN